MSTEIQETPAQVIPLRPKTIQLHTNTIDAINEEMAAYEKREIQLLLEIANLHGVIAAMRVGCEAALAHCMHPKSIQATHLNTAINRADKAVPR